MNIRDRVDLAEAESMFRFRISAAWLLKGVTMLDPDHTYVDAWATLDADVTLCRGPHSRVGPFAVLEPGADIPGATVTGPFYTAGPDAP